MLGYLMEAPSCRKGLAGIAADKAAIFGTAVNAASDTGGATPTPKSPAGLTYTGLLSLLERDRDLDVEGDREYLRCLRWRDRDRRL